MSRLDKVFSEIEAWLKTESGIAFHATESRFDSVIKVLGWLDEIQELTNSTVPTVLPIDHGSQVDSRAAKDIISISLHDMKLFNALVRLIIVHGIHPCLDQGVGVPLSVRMKSVPASSDLPAVLDSKSLDGPIKTEQLAYVIERLVSILKNKGDVRDLILIGGYSSDLLCGSMQLAFNKHTNDHEKSDKSQKYKDFYLFIKSQIDTYDLFACYTSLLRPNSPKWFLEALTSELAMIPLDRSKDGVRSLVEFTSGLREKDTLSPSDLDRAVKVLKSVPRRVQLETYAKALGDQLFELLSLTPSNPLVPAAVYITETIEQQRREIIAQGLQRRLLSTLYPSENHDNNHDNSRDNMGVSDVEVEKCLFAISALLKGQHYNVSPLMQTVVTEMLVKLWLLYCFLSKTKRPDSLVKNIIVTLVNVADSSKESKGLNLIGRALLDSTSQFVGGENGGVAIKVDSAQLHTATEDKVIGISFLEQFSVLDERIDLFMGIAKDIDEEKLSRMFTNILQRWLTADQLSVFQETDPLSTLADVKLLQRISQDEKSKLLKSSTEIIQVISTLVKEYALSIEDSSVAKKKHDPLHISLDDSVPRDSALGESVLGDSDDEDEDVNEGPQDSDDEDEGEEQIEAVKVCLSLISMFISEPEVLTIEDMRILETLKPSVELISSSNQVVPQLQSQGTRTLELMRASKYSEDDDDDDDDTTGKNDMDIYQKAIISLDDPMVPIRAHGLYLLRTLVQSGASIVGDGTAILKIFLSQLKDDDSFIYLNCIKGIETIVYVQGVKILPVLLGYYSDTTVDLDQRLKCGEALTKVIQNQAKVLDKSAMGDLIETFISIVSRSSQNKRDVEDNRLRMSSMSLLGLLCEVAPLGVIPWLSDIIDCCIGILTFEQGPEEVHAIMRRSTVVLLSSLYKGFLSSSAVEGAADPPVVPTTWNSQLGILMNRLKNIKSQDSDPIVRDQASSVLEMLENGF